MFKLKELLATDIDKLSIGDLKAFRSDLQIALIEVKRDEGLGLKTAYTVNKNRISIIQLLVNKRLTINRETIKSKSSKAVSYEKNYWRDIVKKLHPKDFERWAINLESQIEVIFK